MINIKTIEKGLLDSDKCVRKAAIMAARYQSHNADVIDDWWQSEDVNFKIASCFSYLGANRMLPKQKIVKVIYECEKQYGNDFASNLLLAGYKRGSLVTSQYPADEFARFYTTKLLKRCAESIMISTPMVIKSLDSTEWYDRCLGLYITTRKECEKIPLFLMVPALESMDPAVREAGILAMKHANANENYLVTRFFEAKNCSTRRATIMKVCQGRKDIHLPLDPNIMLREELMAVRGLSVERSVLDRWEKGSYLERAAGLYALADEPNIPYVLINRGLRDGEPLLHEAAIIVANEHGYPAHKTFEPGNVVFKKCVGNVIVVAKIPKTAAVRGDAHGGGRASEARIISINAEGYCGEKVGIAFYDCSTEYRVGDIVKVKDFDMSLEDCASGFHFFNDYKLAKKFYY